MKPLVRLLKLLFVVLFQNIYKANLLKNKIKSAFMHTDDKHV